MPKPDKLRLPEEIRQSLDADASGQASDLSLKNFRYVVSSVNEDALKAWTDLWEEFKNGVTPAGAVLPQMQEGFQPSCGWAEFLEKFWLLKHYLDYTHRMCNDQNSNPYPNQH
jgi:hypothetical protein